MAKIKKLAINLSRGKTSFFLTSMTPDELVKTARVSRVNEDLEKGFQRTLDESRAKKISSYLLDNKIIPGAIILSCQNNELLSFDDESNTLSFDDEAGSFLVIDGQHRLYGSVLAKETIPDLSVPVCILSNLNHLEEIQYFIDINSTQKGVPKTLRIELTKYLVDEGGIDSTRLKLFDDLNTREGSPLFSKLSSSQRGRGYLTHVPFEAALNKPLSNSPLKDVGYNDKYKLISNFLCGVKANLDEIGLTQKLYQAAFFQAIFRCFEKTCSCTMSLHGNYKVESFKEVFNLIQKIDFEQHSGTNEQAVAALEKDINEYLDIELRSKLTRQDLF